MDFRLKVLFLTAMMAGPLQALVEPDKSGLGQAEFKLSELDINNEFLLPADLPDQAASAAAANLNVLGLSDNAGMVDLRSGRWATLMLSEPLLPGRGKGNNLSWTSLGLKAPKNDAELADRAMQAFRGFIEAAGNELNIDMAELNDSGKTVVHGDGSIIQIYIPRNFNQVPVRGSHLTATINHGNLTLFGTSNWGDINTSTAPGISERAALAAVQSHVGSYQVNGAWGKPEITLIPVANGKDLNQVQLGDGYEYRLAWVIRPAFNGEMRRFEALVDAQTGQLLSFEDTNQYAEAKGGVYPKTNDGVGEDGSEQPDWPMPWMEVGSETTDTGGNFDLAGSQTATFFGPYVNMADNCGVDSLTQADGIDWGVSGGTDCTTPGYGGAGNTHASRSGFYELNRIKEMARSHLPSNTWLQNRLTANMNINLTCNAFWNGSTVNFYRSGGGCANTGEIAAVFDHEWGHGMDANDVVGGIASPSGEGIADIYSALRLYDSCIGRNFLPSVCSGNGDPCLSCTGVRDIDYLQRQSGNPHTYSWSNANCGGSVHCIGAVYSEAVWSLWKRKLQSAPYNYDNNTAAEIVTRLTYIGAGATSTWFSGGPPNGGCAASSGYMNYLAADDDDGDLTNGTPHMTAIYQAFNDQQIACNTLVVQDSGCAGAPVTAPVVGGSAGNQQIDLSWTSVAGATSYDVFRSEGIYACDFGKVKVASTAGTSFNDNGLQNGRDYSYVVIPKGGASCFGPGSSCTTIQPVGVPDFTVSCTPPSSSIAQGDDDTLTCSVGSRFGYTGTVDLSCSGNPAGVSCLFTPASLEPPVNGSGNSTLTLTVDIGQATGLFGFDVVGDDGAVSHTSGISVQVIPAGSNGPQVAVYDAGLGAPKCSVAGGSCDSLALLNGRANLGPEPNQPNTVDTCTDGGSGSYHVDESNDRIVVSSLDGSNMTEGDTVEVSATVYAWDTGAADTLDLYYTADAANPVWNYITSIPAGGGGVRTLTAQYVLPAGSMQAVRANFRYQGAVSSCSTGAYDDDDDLVFAVEAPTVGCSLDSECDDGLFCNGAETCNVGTGLCEAGSAPVCDDGLFCNGVGICNESTDSCDPGTPPVVDDGVSCTVDSCNEATDSIDHLADNAHCDNGAFCDGSETCDVVNDCQAGTPPACDDGAFCNGTETCNESTDSCDIGTPPNVDDGVSCTDDSCNESSDTIVHTPNDGLCSNGLFCDGVETCDVTSDCQAGSDPCSGNACDETLDICIAPPAGDVHVEAVLTTTLSGSKGIKNGVANVTIYDANEAPVGAGYMVTGNFSGTFTEPGAVAFTDANGVAQFVTLGSEKKGVVVNFCVSDVDGVLPYDPADHNSASFACGETPPPPPLTSVHVENIASGTASAGGGRKSGTATVTIFGNDNLPKSGYTVSGTFGGSFDESPAPGVTGADGKVSFQTTATIQGKPTATFCVNDVTGGAVTYDSADNTSPAYACSP